MKSEIPMKDGLEYDIFATRRYWTPNQSKTIKYTKRKYNKRVRKYAKQIIKDNIKDLF